VYVCVCVFEREREAREDEVLVVEDMTDILLL
jgi:hypothetical protein